MATQASSSKKIIRGKRPLQTYPKGAKGMEKALPRVYKRIESVDQKQNRQIKNLKDSVASTEGYYTYIRRTQSSVASDIGRAEFKATILSNSNTLKETVLATVPFFDPSAPTTPDLTDCTVGNFSKEFRFTAVTQRIKVVNNYVIPAYVSVYVIVPRQDTSKAVLSTFNEGLDDVVDESTDLAYNPTIKLYDSPHFKKLFKIVKTTSKLLKPGQQIVQWYKTKPFTYDPSYNDSHASTYKPKHGAFQTLIRLEGAFGRDGTQANAEYSALKAAVDYDIQIRYDIKYDAGAKIRWFIVSDDTKTDAFTTSGQHPLMPQPVMTAFPTA